MEVGKKKALMIREKLKITKTFNVLFQLIWLDEKHRLGKAKILKSTLAKLEDHFRQRGTFLEHELPMQTIRKMADC